eukprot:527976-Prymnesium_polylepis.1
MPRSGDVLPPTSQTSAVHAYGGVEGKFSYVRGLRAYAATQARTWPGWARRGPSLDHRPR